MSVLGYPQVFQPGILQVESQNNKEVWHLYLFESKPYMTKITESTSEVYYTIITSHRMSSQNFCSEERLYKTFYTTTPSQTHSRNLYIESARSAANFQVPVNDVDFIVELIIKSAVFTSVKDVGT